MPPWWRCRFCQREEIRGGGWRSKLPVVKKGCRFCLREEVHGGWRSGLPIVKKGGKGWNCLVASIGKKRVSKTDIATGQVVEEMHLVAELEQRTYIEQQLAALGL